jgi:hypothetical protein
VLSCYDPVSYQTYSPDLDDNWLVDQLNSNYSTIKWQHEGFLGWTFSVKKLGYAQFIRVSALDSALSHTIDL